MTAARISAKRAHLAHLLLKAWTPLQELSFITAHRCDVLRALADDAKRGGRTISAQEVAAMGEVIKARASDALRALLAAYEQAVEVELVEDKEAA